MHTFPPLRSTLTLYPDDVFVLQILPVLMMILRFSGSKPCHHENTGDALISDDQWRMAISDVRVSHPRMSVDSHLGTALQQNPS